MAYGTVKVDNITFTNAGIDQTITVSGIVASISGNITATGTIQGANIIGTTLVSGATVTGNSASFTTITGGTVTLTSGVFASGTAAAPSVSIGTTDNGLYSPGADQVAISSNGTGRLFVRSDGTVVATTALSVSDVSSNDRLQLIYGTSDGSILGHRIAATGVDLNYITRLGQNGSHIFSTNNAGVTAERLRITSDGKLGLGTSSPSARLTIGTQNNADVPLRVFSSSSTNSIECVGRTTNNRNVIKFYNSDGTTEQFDITSTQSTVNISGLLSNQDLTLKTNNTERLRITSDGKLGLGTSSPISTFTAKSSANNWAASFGADISQNQYTGISLGYGPGGIYHKGAIAFIRTDATNGAGDFAFCLGSTSNATNVAIGDEKVRITSTGNVGIGTQTPSDPLHVIGQIRADYAGTKIVTLYPGNAANTPAIGFTSGESLRFVGTSEYGRWDSSGRFLVGTSSSRSNFFNASTITPAVQVEGTDGNITRFSSVVHNANNSVGPHYILGKTRSTTAGGSTLVASGDALGALSFMGADGTELVTAAEIYAEVDGTPGANDMPGRLVFSTTADGASSPTERMRINAAGGFKWSDNATYTSATDAKAEFRQSTNVEGLSVRSTNASLTSVVLLVRADRNASGGEYNFITAGVTGVDTRFIVANDGDVTNTNNSYGGISDIKLKENIVDANSQWDDLKALQVRNYNFKEGQTHTQIGLVAQEVELVSPGLVSESPDRDEEGNDLGTVTKSINYSVLYMKAVKALQEAMERIETLEQRLNDAGIA